MEVQKLTAECKRLEPNLKKREKRQRKKKRETQSQLQRGGRGRQRRRRGGGGRRGRRRRGHAERRIRHSRRLTNFQRLDIRIFEMVRDQNCFLGNFRKNTT